MRRFVLGAMLTLVAAAGSAAALDGDVERGRGIVVGAASAGRDAPVGQDLSCLGCHGIAGAGDAKAAYPRLAGLAPFYLYKQLKDYAAGHRRSPAMEPIARALDEQAMRDVAAYYAAQAPADGPFPAAAPEVLALGRTIAGEGLPERGVQPCAACHGPRGLGSPPALPHLAGQHASYLADQLVQWKRGTRRNDPLGSMAVIAGRLTDGEIRAVAAWYAAQPPSGPFRPARFP